MRTDPKFQPKSRDQVLFDYYRLKTAVDAKVPQYFSKLPKTQLVILPYPPFREKFEAAAAYDAGHARRLAARHLLFQCLRPAVAQHLGR